MGKTKQWGDFMGQMFFTDKKLEKRIAELAQYRYRDLQSFEFFYTKEDEEKQTNPVIPQELSGTDDARAYAEVLRVGDRWSGRDRYVWLKKDIVIPAQWAGRRVLGLFDFGRTGGGNNDGFESMCYLEGRPYQGVDGNHKEVFLKEEQVGRPLSFVFRLWSGLEGGGIPTPQEHKINYAFLGWLDEKTDDLYYLSKMVLETVELLPEDTPVVYDLRRALEDAFRLIDWCNPGSEVFYESVHCADDLLNERMDGMDKQSLVTVNMVGHTHIDVAWLWRLKHTCEKASRSFSTVLRLMELFPDYIFLQTQPRIYAYIKEDFPEIYEEIRQRVKEGRWEIDGAMWVEADCNLTSGESLTRQILLGSRFMKEEFGKDPEYLWLPDVFGYSWALPQILKKSGIDTFMTTKISWNQFNRMPHDTFYWKGMDGTEILTHFITTPDPGSDMGPFFYTYNGMISPETIQGVWKGYQDKEINKDLLISYGYGDGGGGVNREMLECIQRLEKIPGLPKVQTSTAGEYFRKLHETVDHTDQYVHTWDGELYLEYHRGTYTSQGYNKRMNRKMELLYRKAEWLTAMKGILAGILSDAKQEELTAGWYDILTNQFHDIIPGSSIHDVYEDCRKMYPQIEQTAKNVEQDFYASCMEKEEGCYTVFNASSWNLDGLVKVYGCQEGCFTDEDGIELLSQNCGDHVLVSVPEIPSMGSRSIYCRESLGESSQEQRVPFIVEDWKIETPYYHLVLNEVGQISRLYDKEAQREVLPEGACANVLQMFEDKPMNFDAWDIDIYYQEKMWEITELRRMEVTECGPLRLVIRLEWEYMKSEFVQDMILYANDRRIDFVTEAEFQERQQLLKVAFPVDIRSTYATYDIQYGNVQRPTHWNTSWDWARFEKVGHRFADLSERGYGVSLMNDCKYGYDVKDNVMRLSLLKSALQPDHLQDLGHHVFTYSLLPHMGDFVEGKTVQEAHVLNNPFEAEAGKAPALAKQFLSFSGSQIEVDAVKKSEDGKYLVIRVHEFTGSRSLLTVKTGFEFRNWMIGDLRERPTGEVHSWSETGNEISFCLKPYEIVTLLLEV